MESQLFRFKQFAVEQSASAMKIGTDSVLLGAWTEIGHVRRVLDIGAGTGVLSLMLAQKMATCLELETTKVEFEKNGTLEKAVENSISISEKRENDILIHAVELDAASASEAKSNFERSAWSAWLEIFEETIQNFSQRVDFQYDLIVSNPPFFSGGTFDMAENRRAVRHNFQLPNGDLLKAVRRLLSPEGRFCVILPHLEGLRFAEMAAVYGLYLTRQTDVFSRPEKPTERLLMQFEKRPFDFERDSISIYSADGGHSSVFKQLTSAYYLDF